MARTRQAAVHTRANQKYCLDQNGVLYRTPYGMPALHWDPSLGATLGPAIWLNGSHQNICLYSETFGTGWTAGGSPTRVAAAHTAAGVSLDLIGDDDATTVEGYYQNPTFTGDGVKAVSLHVKAGSSTSSVIWLRDISGGTADRCRFVLTWSGGLPVLTQGGAGTYHGYEPMADGVFRLLFSSSSVTAANNHRFYLYPATTNLFAVADVGTLYAGGVQFQDATVPGPYIQTTSAAVSLAADALSLAFSPTPAACAASGVTLYDDIIVQRPGETNAVTVIGRSSYSGTNKISVYCEAVGVTAAFNNGSTAVTSSRTVTLAVGDRLKRLVTVSPTGVITLTTSLNGAASVVSTASAGQAWNTAWDTQAIYLNEASTAAAKGDMGRFSTRVAFGVRSSAYMEAA